MQKLFACFLTIVLPFIVFAQSNSYCLRTPLPMKPNLGVNMSAIDDWGRDRLFNDVFKAHRGFSNTPATPWAGSMPTVDADGWPTQDFGTVVMSNMSSTMGGTYKIRFNGQATISTIASGMTVRNKVYDPTTNTTTADFEYPSPLINLGQMILSFTNTDFGGGVKGIKNIQIMKPTLAFNAPTFSQQMLDHLQAFSTIRAMDLHKTNANPDSLWSNRTQATSLHQSQSAGLAWEYIIELANTAKKDLWVNIPHKANDNYVEQLALLLKNTLDPSLNLYVEYSNEVWNWSFEQAQWNLRQAKVQGNANGAVNFDNINDQYRWHYRLIAKRGKEISDIFRAVFGNAQMMTRVRPVYALQVGWYDVGREGIEFIKNYYGSPDNYFYAIAGAPYFNTAEADATNTATKQDIIDNLTTNMNALFGFNSSLERYKALANHLNLHFICYEGGPDTFGANNIAAKADAMRDPQMKQLVVDFLNQWYAYGSGELFCWYLAGAANYDSPYGTWTLTEDFENSPKLQAMNTILAQTPTMPTKGQAVSSLIDPRKYVGYPAGWNSIAYFAPDWEDVRYYLINVSQAGTYNLSLSVASAQSGQTVPFSINGGTFANITIPNTGSLNTYANTTNIPVNLPAGLLSLRLNLTNKNYRIQAINFNLTQACPNCGCRTITIAVN